MSIKQVIIVRKDLGMGKGKIGSQCAHASVGVVLSILGNGKGDSIFRGWLDSGQTKVCLGVGSESELISLYELAKGRGIRVNLVRDAGRTEFGGVATYTCFAMGPDVSERLDSISGHLALL